MVSNGGAARKRAAGPTDQSGVIATARQPACRTERDIRAGAGAFQLIFKGLQQRQKRFKMPERKKTLREVCHNLTIILQKKEILKGVKILRRHFLPPLFPHRPRHTATGNMCESDREVWEQGLIIIKGNCG